MADETLPSGIYYDKDTDNFYCMLNNAGMGPSFYDRWKPRSSEFPSERTHISLDRTPTVARLLDHVKPDKDLAELEKSVRAIENVIPHLDALAKMRRAAFVAYVKAGFTEAQALELCTK